MNREKVAIYADEMIRLADAASLSEPITSCETDFTVDDAYAVSREALARRERSGWRWVGRKIGFTNRTIWDQYGVYQPIFGYMYEQTVTYVNDLPPLPPGEGRGEGSAAHVSLSGLVQPLIEPEIVFGLKAAPPLTDDPLALLGAIDWVGHGFEVVQCHFPDWKFGIADTIADGGLHGRYVVGPRFAVEPGSEAELADRLSSFRITLFKDGALAAAGGGDLVLGSPLSALVHFVKVLASLPDHPRLQAGEIVTTGTLTTALPVAPGETWSTRFDGLSMPGLTLRFT